MPLYVVQGMGDMIGIDAEFVALEMEKAKVQQDGTRVVAKEGRQALARLSIIDNRTGKSVRQDVRSWKETAKERAWWIGNRSP